MRAIENRMARLERLAVERLEGPRVCNCRLETRFHSGVCLAAILKGLSWECSVHEFRDLGYLRWVVLEWQEVTPGDEQFCPCVRVPAMSWFPLNTQTGDAAREAATRLLADHQIDLEEDGRVAEAAVAEYDRALIEWVERTGRRPAGKEEIAKLIRERERNHVDY